VFFRMKFSIPALAASALVLCTACTDSAPTEQTTFFAMDTAVSITLPADSSAQSAQEAITALSGSLDSFRADSVVSSLNETGQVTDAALAKILSQTASLSDRFGDAVSLTCGNVTKLWGISTDSPAVPSEQELHTALQTVDDTQIRLQGDQITLENGAALDLGSVAKGYALDAVYERWQTEDVPYGICSMHSAVLLFGEKPDKSLFTVQIQSPDDAAKTLGTVSVPACFLATAGGYERYFTADDGNEYCHILDLQTGYPVQSDLTTVTVFTDNGLKADYLSTLIFLEGTESIQSHLTAADYQIVAADQNGTLYISDGLQFTEAPV